MFAWLEARQRAWLHGENGATGLTPERIEIYGRAMRNVVSRYMQQTLGNQFHNELHLLAYSGDCDWLVRPMVITHSGDRDHLRHVALCGAAGRMAVVGRYD